MVNNDSGRGVRFNIDKLKQLDKGEIQHVAKHYAKRELTNKQVADIAYNAKEALDIIQRIAREISKSQSDAFKANERINRSAFHFSSQSQEKSNGSEEKRDAYGHAERLNKDSTDSQERMNRENNSTWKVVGVGASVAASVVGVAVAILAYNKSK